MEPVDAQGLWWLPGNPDHRVGGRLTFNESEGGRLVLSDRIRRQDSALPDGGTQRIRTRHSDEREYGVVHGQVGNVEYTLMDTFVLKRSLGLSGGPSPETLHVNSIAVGAWFANQDDDFVATALEVRLSHLTRFVNQSDLEIDWPTAEGQGRPWVKVSADRHPPLTAQVGPAVAKLWNSIDASGDQTDTFSLTINWILRVEADEPLPFKVLFEVASDLQDLVTIAGDRPASIESLHLQHPDVPVRSPAGPRRDLLERIDYRAKWTIVDPDDRPLQNHEFFFQLGDLGGADGLQRWLNAAEKYRTQLGRIISVRCNPSSFLEDRVSNACAALESFDMVRRGLKNDKGIVNHLTSCIAFAGDVFTDLIVEDVGNWVERVREIRHDLAHHRRGMQENTTPIDHLVSEQLYWLFVLCMLRAASAEPACFERIARHRQISWLRERAALTSQPTGVDAVDT